MPERDVFIFVGGMIGTAPHREQKGGGRETWAGVPGGEPRKFLLAYDPKTVHDVQVWVEVL